MVQNLAANAGDLKDVGSIPGPGRSPGGGYGHPLQCSCLENPLDRGAWWARVHGVAKSRTRLQRLSTLMPNNTQDAPNGGHIFHFQEINSVNLALQMRKQRQGWPDAS